MAQTCCIAGIARVLRKRHKVDLRICVYCSEEEPVYTIPILTQKKYGGVEPLFRRSLALQERTLGPDHPDVAITINGLASFFILVVSFFEILYLVG